MKRKRSNGSPLWVAVGYVALKCSTWNILGAQVPTPPTDLVLRQGHALLAQRQFAAAKLLFSNYLRDHPGALQAMVGEGEAELGLQQFGAAEVSFRAAVALQPQLWEAHKRLVLVEAKLGRWDEFDRERTVLRMARERGAPGLEARESDVIDSFRVRGGQWVVRSYFEPVGRSEARYNFQRFSPDGRVAAYLSLEDAGAAQAALTPSNVRIGGKDAVAANSARNGSLSLNWYTGAAHGTVRAYGSAEPTYERLRTDVQVWLRQHPESAVTGPPSTE